MVGPHSGTTVGDIKGRVPRQVPGEGVFLGEKANLEFLDLIRKQLGCIQGGVAWGGLSLWDMGQHCRKKAWRGAGEWVLARTPNSMRQPLSSPEPKRHLPPCSEAMQVSGDAHTSSSSFRRQSRPCLYSKTKPIAILLRVFVYGQTRSLPLYHPLCGHLFSLP